MNIENTEVKSLITLLLTGIVLISAILVSNNTYASINYSYSENIINADSDTTTYSKANP